MKPNNTTETITELPVEELSLAGASTSPDYEKEIAQKLQACASALSSEVLAILPTGTDVFQVLPVYEKTLLPQDVPGLLTAQKDCVYIVRVNDS